MIRTMPLFLVFFASQLLAAEDIYREIGEDGVPVFSDQKRGEKIEVRETVTFSDPIVHKKLRKTEKLSPESSGPVDYTLTVTGPEGAAVRDNAGNLTLDLTITPGLGIGHSAELLIDGVAIRKVDGSGPVSLTNVDRGTHEFSLQVIDEKGNVLDKGEASSITILRYSKLNRPK